ncbi:transcriptional repressor [Gluconacetobacter entanii]|uniref:Transcriptional repressor n=1 Tax=Gluconacetobacter entanii TaxID=108528 RepID=A0A318PYD9_9PROT|nr:transcriptional repressor [Gluconacetobacter entanii]MCE2579301.1 transcriptional repressor [Komagataeibacter sp. FNDCR1]MBY4638768.1 transcriptional repressor [Gluconacetobacter entanii]MCW4580777.1 transcriptional repressor [Gluconacetobacter entanii]MCW4584106.1 transcriptional repressor [Gluconacetobacter entanii]MCW4587431.1 transcriptional repressor [Gluconacetobacter entanii]
MGKDDRHDDTGTQTTVFGVEVERMLDRAHDMCRRHGARMTQQRRLVLGLVLSADRPIGAYDLLDRLRRDTKGAAPPTVYRALDFLLEQGLIHKIERLSAFVACRHMLHSAHECDNHLHSAQFLICTKCGHVTELEDSQIVHALVTATQARQFSLRTSTIEAEGICAACS